MVRTGFFGFVIFIVSAASASAQSEECSKALMRDTSLSNLSETERVSFNLALDQGSFEEIKRNASVRGDLPIGDVTIGGQANYNDYQQRLNQLKEQFKLQDDYQYKSLIVTSRLSKANLESYTQCILSRSLGLGISLLEFTNKTISVRVFYGTAPSDHTERYIEVTADKAEVMSPSARITFQGPASYDFALTRSAPGPVKVVVTEGVGQNLEASKTLDTVPMPPRLFRKTGVTRRTVSTQQYINADTGPINVDVCVNASDEGLLVPTTYRAYFTDQYFSGNPSYGFQGVSGDRHRLCERAVSCSRSPGWNCSANFHLDAIEEVPNWTEIEE